MHLSVDDDAGLVGSGHGRMQGRELTHHTLVGLLLIGMDSLGMLAEIVETREPLSTMIGEKTFADVWMSDSGTDEGQREEERARNTVLMCLAKSSLLGITSIVMHSMKEHVREMTIVNPPLIRKQAEKTYRFIAILLNKTNNRAEDGD